jgi:hypothetical protein
MTPFEDPFAVLARELEACPLREAAPVRGRRKRVKTKKSWSLRSDSVHCLKSQY